MAKAEPKGWINWLDWVSPPAARFGPRSQALLVAILWFPVRTHRPIPPPAQNLLVSPITLDLATCNLQLAICDCDRRLATWQLALAADNSLVELLSVDCPEPGALHRPTPAANGGGGVFANWLETGRTKRGGHRADRDWSPLLPPLFARDKPQSGF